MAPAPKMQTFILRLPEPISILLRAAQCRPPARALHGAGGGLIDYATVTPSSTTRGIAHGPLSGPGRGEAQDRHRRAPAAHQPGRVGAARAARGALPHRRPRG